MSNRIKKIYKCSECETMITIITKVHELPESIICPCDNVAENQGSKWKSLTTKYLSIRLKEQQSWKIHAYRPPKEDKEVGKDLQHFKKFMEEYVNGGFDKLWAKIESARLFLRTMTTALLIC